MKRATGISNQIAISNLAGGPTPSVLFPPLMCADISQLCLPNLLLKTRTTTYPRTPTGAVPYRSGYRRVAPRAGFQVEGDHPQKGEAGSGGSADRVYSGGNEQARSTYSYVSILLVVLVSVSQDETVV
jgi:hypothetical protein